MNHLEIYNSAAELKEMSAKEKFAWGSWKVPCEIGIIFPLYINPDVSDGAWDRLFSMLDQYPTVNWKIVVNPFNGPNGPSPQGNYVTLVPKLTAYKNVNLHGYVHTKQLGSNNELVKRNQIDVANDIYNWTQWPANARPTGLFVDECSNGFEVPSDVDYYADLAAYARGTGSIDGASVTRLTGNFFTNIIFNPGGVMNGTSYFAYADQILMLENDWVKCQLDQVGYPDTDGRKVDGGLLYLSRAVMAVDVPQHQKSIMIYNASFNFMVHGTPPEWLFLNWLGYDNGGPIDSVFLSSNAPAADGSGGVYSQFADNFEDFVRFLALGFRGPFPALGDQVLRRPQGTIYDNK